MWVGFKEYCDREGETWTIWINEEENEEALLILGKLIDHADEFEFWPDKESEAAVDILVKYAGGDYMSEHIKLEKKINAQALLDMHRDGNNTDDLYKGGLRSLLIIS